MIFLKFSWFPSYFFVFIFLLMYLLPRKVLLAVLSKNHRKLMTSLLCLLIIYHYQICLHLSCLRSSSPRYTFFSNAHRTFSRIGHILGHKSSLSSVQFSHSVVSNTLGPYELQNTRPPCPSPSPGVHSTHVHRVGDAIQPSHPRSSPSPPAPNPSQHQSLFQWVNSSHELAKVMELQL